MPALRLVSGLLVLACLGTVATAARRPAPPVDAVSLGGLERRLRVVASDQFAGRESLSPGFRAAAAYLAEELAALGLTPRGDAGSYLQRVTMRRSVVDPETTRLEIDGVPFAHGKALLASGHGAASGPVVYVGHGWRIPALGIDPFAGLDVSGAILLTLPGLPEGVTAAGLDRLERGRDYWAPEDNVQRLGAAGILRVASAEDRSAWSRTARRQSGPGDLVVERLAEPAGLPIAILGTEALAALMTGERDSGERLEARALARDAGEPFALRRGRAVTLSVAATVTREDTFNVVASVEGAGGPLAGEYVALGAHLDHLPPLQSENARDRIHNGADDDGSGVVALVEMAAAAMRGPRPGRSLLFVWHTGEEAGGWGSRYFMAFPTVPRDRIVAQLNLDMVGRSRRLDDKTAANAGLTGPHEIYLVGASRTSRALDEAVRRVNREFLRLHLNPAHDRPDDPHRIYERSDHYEYARRGIPVAFFFSGLHEDYHQVSDEVDRIDFVKLQKVARTVLAVAWDLAARPERPALDGTAGADAALSGR